MFPSLTIAAAARGRATRALFVGHTGTVGSAILPRLLQAHEQEKIDLRIIHRQGSDLSSIPTNLGVDVRMVDYDEPASLAKAVEGVEVVLSTVGITAVAKVECALLDAIGSLPPASRKLKTFIHSDFGLNFTPAELDLLGEQFIKGKLAVLKTAAQHGVGLTRIKVGSIDRWFFGLGNLGVDVKGNIVRLYKDAMDSPVRLVTMDYLSYATAQLVVDPAHSAQPSPAGEIQIMDLAPTGREIVQALTNIHGSPTEITYYTEAQNEADIKAGGFACLGAIKRRKWGDKGYAGYGWGPEGNGLGVVEGWAGTRLEDVIRRWM